MVLWRVGSLYARRYDKQSNSWGPQHTIATSTTKTRLEEPRLIFGSGGDVFAVWRRGSPNHGPLWTARFSQGSWKAPQRVTPASEGVPDWHASGNATGGAVIVWRGMVQQGPHVTRSDGSGNWSTDTASNGPHCAESPVVANDAAGNGVAVWGDQCGSKPWGLYAARFDVQTGLQPPQLVWPYTGSGAIPRPQSADIAMNDAGDAVLATFGHRRRAIQSFRYSGARNTWSSMVLIDSQLYQDLTNPRVAIDASGTATIVYQRYDTARSNIWATRCP